MRESGSRQPGIRLNWVLAMGVLVLVTIIQINYDDNQDFQKFQPNELMDTTAVDTPSTIPTHNYPKTKSTDKQEPPITREELESELDNYQPQ